MGASLEGEGLGGGCVLQLLQLQVSLQLILPNQSVVSVLVDLSADVFAVVVAVCQQLGEFLLVLLRWFLLVLLLLELRCSIIVVLMLLLLYCCQNCCCVF